VEQLLNNKYALLPAPAPVASPWIIGILIDRGVVHLNFAGRANGRYRIEASTDLIRWTVVGTTTASLVGLSTFSHAIHASDARFYRVANAP
jgi:hypothetical protein